MHYLAGYWESQDRQDRQTLPRCQNPERDCPKVLNLIPTVIVCLIMVYTDFAFLTKIVFRYFIHFAYPVSRQLKLCLFAYFVINEEYYVMGANSKERKLEDGDLGWNLDMRNRKSSKDDQPLKPNFTPFFFLFWLPRTYTHFRDYHCDLPLGSMDVGILLF